MKIFSKDIFSRVLSARKSLRLDWRLAFRRLAVIKALAAKISLITFGSLTKERSIAAHIVGKRVVRLIRKSGYLTAALYLKQCAVCLQQAYAGQKITSVSTPVSLTRTGYPRIILSYHRRMIRKKDSKSDKLVQWYLSIFSISRAVLLAKRRSYKMFDTMLDKGSTDSYLAVMKLLPKLRGKIENLRGISRLSKEFL